MKFAPAKLVNCLDGAEYDGTSAGIYVVQSVERPDVVRVGSAGGGRNTKGRLNDRVPKHCAPWKGRVTVETHLLAPYKAGLIWELPGWPWTRVAMAELALYEAVEELGWDRHSGQLKDTSNYTMPAHGLLTDLVAVMSGKIETIRSA